MSDEDREQATAEEIEAARELYQTDDVQIDDGAEVSHADDAFWVQAWVRVET